MIGRGFSAFVCFALVSLGSLSAQSAGSFQVRYVAAGTIYLDAGSDDGLAEGMELDVKRSEPGAPLTAKQDIGRVKVIAVASHSAACEVLSEDSPIRKGDLAELSGADAEVAAYLLSSENSRPYAQIVTFTDLEEGNPLEEEQREYVPRPPLHEINRASGYVSVQQNSLFDRNLGTSSLQEGLAIRADMTRIDGSYWNFNGYWRGRVNSRGRRDQQTLTDLLNRTYQIGFTYNNPHSRNVIGAGRLLLPWASSLSTLDGGYFARRLSTTTTAGVFAGTTPDPTAWNYDPDRQIMGVFSSFEKGSFDDVRYTGTVGVAHTRRHWKPERKFAFFENHLSVNRALSVYHNMEVDHRSQQQFGTGGPQLSRSFFTVRARANDVVSVDLSHNYFRGIPTFDTRLIGTGLLDQYLFQGVTGGVRFELPRRSALYANLGRSSQQSDATPSWNYLLGFTLGRLPYINLRSDVRTSRFSSSFGTGSYNSVSLSRQIGEAFRFEFQGGQQNFRSPLTEQNRARWLNSTLDWFAGEHYILGFGFTAYRGRVQNYDQLFVNLGYRF